MKSILEKIENRLKELNNIKENIINKDGFKFNKAIELNEINARIDELNKLLDE